MKQEKIKFRSPNLKRAVETQQSVGAFLMFNTYSCHYAEMSASRSYMGDVTEDVFTSLSFGFWINKLNKHQVGKDFPRRPLDGVSGWMSTEFDDDLVHFRTFIGFDRNTDPVLTKRLMRRRWRLVSERGAFQSCPVSSVAELSEVASPVFLSTFMAGDASGFGMFDGM